MKVCLPMLVMLMASTSCSATPPSGTPGTIAVPAGQTVFVGRLTENVPLGVGNPSAYCLEDGKLYETASHRMEGVNVFGVGALVTLTGAAARDIVAVTGRLEHGLDKAVKAVGPCPKAYLEPEIMQMRSDWVSPECGFDLGRSTTAKLATLDYIVAERIARVELVEVLTKGPTARVRVRNPFDVELRDVTVVWHYETRSKGKPMGHEERTTLTLPAGASNVIEAEATLSAPPEHVARRGGGRLEWVELRKDDGPVHLRTLTILR